MAHKIDSILQKIKGIKDLRKMIVDAKKSAVEKNDQADKTLDEVKVKHQKSEIMYLSKSGPVNGVLTHIIGRDAKPMYNMDVHLGRKSKQLPAITVHKIDDEGKYSDSCDKHFTDVKDAIKAIVHHDSNKKWE